MNKIMKYSLFLIVLCIITGSLLVFVNSITYPITTERKKEEVKRLIQKDFAYADYSVDKSGGYSNLERGILEIYFAFDEEGNVAAVIYKTSYTGYAGEVVSLIGIKADGTFQNAVVSDIGSESPGIGTRVVGHDFKITDKSVDSYNYEIIANVTVTSLAVGRGIDAAARHFKTIQNTLGGIKND